MVSGMSSEQEWFKPAIAEFVGVFALVFIGAGAIITSGMMGLASGGAGLILVALAHGLAIGTMVTALGHISGAHFNPAVTMAALFTKRIKPDLGVIYIIFQLLGGVFGAFMLSVALPASSWQAPTNLGVPAISANITVAQAFFIETILTFFLVFVVFGAGVDPANRNGFKAAGGLAIGFVVMMDILMGGPLTGAAMNPARAFGPALVAGAWTHQLVYWAAPLLGGVLAGALYDSLYLSQRPAKKAPPMKEPRMLEPEPEMTPGGHDPTSLDDPKS
jgi:aquaporin TIP